MSDYDELKDPWVGIVDQKSSNRNLIREIAKLMEQKTMVEDLKEAVDQETSGPFIRHSTGQPGIDSLRSGGHDRRPHNFTESDGPGPTPMDSAFEALKEKVLFSIRLDGNDGAYKELSNSPPSKLRPNEGVLKTGSHFAGAESKPE
ncbi:unnamed protein product [Allacma fusca]|uniref:Uncharacterized protein n=1 Tax=Allacma fusca TaxID=39272 RepID=A0A8J2LBU9_9HEXA|nr:unnamed protein product [Allacma fusca]